MGNDCVSKRLERDTYRSWRETRRTDLAGLTTKEKVAWNSLITVVISDCHKADPNDLSATLESLLKQNWNNVEVSLFFNGQIRTVEQHRFAKLRGLFSHKDTRLRDLFSSGPVKVGLRGEYILVAAPGTVFDVAAFDVLNRAIASSPSRNTPDILVFDYEVGSPSDATCTPVFLPGWDPDFLQDYDYLNGAVLIKSELIDRFANETGADTIQQWLTEAAGSAFNLKAIHIKEVLMSVPRAKCAHLEKRKGGLPAPSLHSGEGQFSVVIPNRNKADLLRKCVSSVVKNKMVKQLIIVDNRSDDGETLEYYENLKRYFGATVAEVNQPFNFSHMINVGVAASNEKLLLLLNNDIEFLEPSVIDTILAVALRPDVGVVGSKLHYPDLTVQHAGIVLGYHPNEFLVRAMHVGRGADVKSDGYLGQYARIRNYQAVTGALMGLRRSVFDSVGGFDEVSLPVEFNDIDFCLRVRETGLKILNLPLEGVIHHESASRGKTDSDQVQRMRLDAQMLMARRWLAQFQNDPYHHPVARLGEKPEVIFNFTSAFL
jgi:O-antigen biosynthesis protein